VTAALRDVGGYPADNVITALGPDRAGLLAAFATLRDRLQRQTSRGEQARLVFYYSGHARADAITLGRDEIPLAELRQQILGLPSTLTIVIIDACQSGAFSRIKGAEPTSDFSFNSLARLNTAGLAVMASSSGTELSQESDQLASSYFTHHLLSALRGAGDANPRRQGQPGRGLSIRLKPHAGGHGGDGGRRAARHARDRAQGQGRRRADAAVVGVVA
jgi:hypothetical protein